MKRIALLILISGLVYTQLNAQGFGYKGRKVSFVYTIHAFPAVFNHTYSDFKNHSVIEDSEGDVGINLRHSLSAEISVSRLSSLGLKYQYFKTGMSFYEPGYPGEIAGLINHAVGLYYRLYRKNKGSISPIGPYHQLDLFLISSTSYVLSTLKGIDKVKYATMNIPALTYSFGNQMIFADRIIGDIAIETGFPLHPLVISSGENEVKNNTVDRLMNHLLINLTFSIGLNAF